MSEARGKKYGRKIIKLFLKTHCRFCDKHISWALGHAEISRNRKNAQLPVKHLKNPLTSHIITHLGEVHPLCSRYIYTMTFEKHKAYEKHGTYDAKRK